MKKLLIMASLFYPQKNGGGPPVSIMNVIRVIQGKYELYVISKNHEVGSTEKLPGIEQGWKEYDFGKVFYFNHGEHTMKNVYNLIAEIKPDLIYQNSLFSYDDVIPVLRYKKKHKQIGVIIAPRGELCKNRFAVGQQKKTLYVKLLKCIGLLNNVKYQATGEEEVSDIMTVTGTIPENVYNINNFSVADKRYLCTKEKKVGELSLCFIARIQGTKNLLYAIQRLANVKGYITYDIYGPIENHAYYEACMAVKLPENVQIRYCGVVDHDQVGRVVSQYHAYYMPTIGENYGHSIVEGMLYQRPVIISNMTPWNDINEACCGYVLPLEQPERFEHALEAMCAMGNNDYQQMCSRAKTFIEVRLNIPAITAQYVQCFDEV